MYVSSSNGDLAKTVSNLNKLSMLVCSIGDDVTGWRFPIPPVLLAVLLAIILTVILCTSYTGINVVT